MNPACEKCRGACCEGLILPQTMSSDVNRWLWFHGFVVPGGVMIPAKCCHLRNGYCAIWEQRPNVCSEYQVGGIDCRKTIMALRLWDADAIEALLPTKPATPED